MIVFAFLLWSGIGAPAAATEDPEQVAVVPIVVGNLGELSLSVIFKTVREEAEKHLGLTVLSEEEAFAARGGVIQETLRECGSDEACVSRTFRQLSTRWGLFVLVNALSEPPFVGLRLVDTQAQKVVGSELGVVSEEERSLLGALRSRAQKLFPATGHLVAGRITFELDPPDARVRRLGENVLPDPANRHTFSLPPGRHRFRLEHDDHQPLELEVEMVAGKEQKASYTLQPSDHVLSSIWFWSLLSAAIIASVVVVGIAVQPGDPCVCVSPPGGICPDC